jgi:hypothetical protein
VWYEIRVDGVLTDDWAGWFCSSQVRSGLGGETTITCDVPDQAALRGLLDRISDLGLDLIAVARMDGDDAGREPGAPDGADGGDVDV